MTYKNTKTILFASLIVAMVLPFSGMQFVDATHVNGEEHTPDKSHVPMGATTNGTNTGENMTIGDLQFLINTSQVKIAHLQVLVLIDEEIYETRSALIIGHQELVNRIDALVNSGVLLTHDQTVSYNESVSEILRLQGINVNTANRISIHYEQIAYYQDTIDWAQAEIDSRVTSAPIVLPPTEDDESENPVGTP